MTPSPQKRRERRASGVARGRGAVNSSPSPYTVEGALAGIGDFAAAINRTTGWRRVAAKVLVIVLFLVPLAWNAVSMAVDLFG